MHTVYLCVYVYAYTHALVKNGTTEDKILWNLVYDLIPTVQNKQPFFTAS